MKLGSPVFITRKPLRKPMPSATTSETKTATQTLMCQWVIMMPVIRPVVPVMAPADRSNSPPIISSATATAMIANDDDVKIHVLAPAGRANAVGGEREVQEDHERGDGGADLGTTQDGRQPGVLPARVRRGRAVGWLSTGGGAAAVVLMRALLGLVVRRETGGGGPARAGPRPSGSAGAALGELQHVLRRCPW